MENGSEASAAVAAEVWRKVRRFMVGAGRGREF